VGVIVGVISLYRKRASTTKILLARRNAHITINMSTDATASAARIPVLRDEYFRQMKGRAHRVTVDVLENVLDQISTHESSIITFSDEDADPQSPLYPVDPHETLKKFVSRLPKRDELFMGVRLNSEYICLIFIHL
jgi:hypothetical protein